jgi:hypothetical protein
VTSASSDWRAKINALINGKTLKRSKLTADEQKRLSKLEGIAEQHKRGKNVQPRQLGKLQIER